MGGLLEEKMLGVRHMSIEYDDGYADGYSGKSPQSDTLEYLTGHEDGAYDREADNDSEENWEH